MNASPLALDFRARPHARLRVAGYVLLAIAIVAALVVLHWHSSMRTDLAHERAERDHLDNAASPGTTTAHKKDARGDEEMNHALAVVDKLYLPWDDLFGMVEQAGSGQLGLLGMTPDAAHHTLRITGRAKNLDEVLDYVHRLSEQGSLADVHLMSFSTVEQPGAPAIEFLVGARWVSR